MFIKQKLDEFLTIEKEVMLAQLKVPKGPNYVKALPLPGHR